MEEMENRPDNGLVVRVTGHEVWVDMGGTMVPCVQRGKLRGGELRVVAGDRVVATRPEREGGQGTIEEISPRTSWLPRWVERDNRERVIVANIARLFVVTSLRLPPIHYAFVDRVLVSAESGHVRASVVLNKTDLIDQREADELRAVYASCGYPVICTSAESGDGVDDLISTLGDEVYAFVGASGVGKSSLLNRIDPKLALETRDVGRKTGRGRHTTSFSQLYPFRGGYLADTPGMQVFGFAGTDRTGLPGCFPEMRPFDDMCRFRPCAHSHEPDCAVKDAVESKKIYPSRYESYLKILEEIDQRAARRKR